MANRNFNRRQALEKEVKDLYVKATVVDGDLVLESKVGVASLEWDDTGYFILTLEDRYHALKYFDLTVMAGSPDELVAQVDYSDVDSDDKEIGFYTLRSNVPTDPAEGTSLLIKIEVKNTSAV